MHRNVAGVLSALALVGAVACGGEPIPRVAAKGTTITIPIPKRFEPGFGRSMAATMDPSIWHSALPLTTAYNAALEDPQRGELAFALYGESPGSQPVAYLPLRYITRVQMDQGSQTASPAPGEGVGPGIDGQVLAFVDIPTQVPSDLYRIFVERYKRPPGVTPLGEAFPFQKDQPTINGVEWYGWGRRDPGDPDDFEAGIPFEIVDGVGERFSPLEGWGFTFGGFGSIDVEEPLAVSVPRPKVQLVVGDFLASPIGPAAVEVELAYPPGRAEILGVEVARNQSSEALVVWEPVAQGSTDCTAQDPASIRIHMVDPDQEVAWLWVTYRLVDFTSAACGRIEDGDFQVVEAKAYDADGVLDTAFPGVSIGNFSF